MFTSSLASGVFSAAWTRTTPNGRTSAARRCIEKTVERGWWPTFSAGKMPVSSPAARDWRAFAVSGFVMSVRIARIRIVGKKRFFRERRTCARDVGTGDVES